MVANLNHYRSMLKPETKMVCMVKASAYGAGSYEIAKTLQEHHADYLAVAVADEGSDLRKAGITASIIIMDPELTAFKTMFDYKLEPEVYNFHLLDALIKASNWAESLPTKWEKTERGISAFWFFNRRISCGMSFSSNPNRCIPVSSFT